MKFSGMSPVEIQFIRLYVAAMRRDYYLLRSTMSLMHPSTLGVKDFASAANMAVELDDMHQQFEQKIEAIQKKDNIRKINVSNGPSVDELADLFSLSFFKLVTTEENDTGALIGKTDSGWYSGKPTEWKKTFSLYKNTPNNAINALPDLLSNFLNTLMKFFPFETNYKKWHEGPFGAAKKLWPPETNEIEDYQQYFEDDEDYEEDDDNPFENFFNHDPDSE
jgi:hypothetical protein